MKKFLLCLALALTALSACRKADPDDIFTFPASYRGTLSIVNSNGPFVMEDIYVDYTLDETTGTVDILMLGVKFATRMPATDTTIPGVSAVKQSGGYAISGNDIIPYAGDLVYDRYIITGLSGTMSSESLSFTMSVGGLPCTYEGTAVASGELN